MTTALCEFYGFKTQPFHITTDADLFFESRSHQEALGSLMYGIEERKGLLLITGEVGTGKTTLCKALMERLPKTVRTSLILSPYFSDIQLLQAIVEDFGLEAEKKTRLDIVKKLDAFLIDLSLQQGNAVLVIDEAQNLKPRQLEQIRLLSNLETKHGKLLQIVLVGQPELKANLRRYDLRQIYQRVVIKYDLQPLDSGDVKAYVDFRLSRSGAEGVMVTPEAYQVINDFSKGVPRLINLLCDRALLLGFVRKQKVLDQDILLASMEEIQ
ncbi:MAG TPA: AAA family ATPase [Candidatus Omnitrophota bacterium]|nr:AAA family ATPase [Candidatus Omnitrophota bacterium]HPS37429.1 AAA family ATPase [Candidatus Omnitrophota bacterium]